MADTRLALAIPTYRRSAILAQNLERVLDRARALGIAIYISDDSPDDETEKVVRRLSQTFSDIHYRRNDPALGHDANLIATLSWPDSDYVWLLGDALWVRSDPLDRLVAFLDNQDMVFINSHSDNMRMLSNVEGEQAHMLIRNALWHQTLTGATIYHRRVRNWMQAHGDHLLVKRNFPQLSVVLGYASEQPVRLGWFGERSVGSVIRQSYWRDRAISVFVDDWAALVSAYPKVIPPRDRVTTIRSHSARMNLFNAAMLLELRKSGAFNRATLSQPHFLDAMHLPQWKLWVLLVLPPAVIKTAKRLIRRR